MKVEQLNNVQIDWTKPQVVVNSEGLQVQVATNVVCQDGLFAGICLKDGGYSNGWYKSSFKPQTATSYPIELKLTIESDKEICDLWHRLNVSRDYVFKQSTDELKHGCINPTNFWKELDKLAKERNLYKND